MSSTVKKQSADRGQKIVTSYGRDDSSYDVKNAMGSPMGGSVTNVSHSLPGATAKVEGNATKQKKNGF